MGSSSGKPEFDYLFKVLLIGDSGVGKSSMLLSFSSNTFDDLSPTIAEFSVDFKVKYLTIGGKKLKLAIWDTGCGGEFTDLLGVSIKRVSKMNPANFQPPSPPFHWAPVLPPDPPRCGVFWNKKNIIDQLKQLQDTVYLAKSMEKELEALKIIKDEKGSTEIIEQGSEVECLRYLAAMKMDLGQQEILSVEAANSLMSTLRAQLEPFRFVVDENSPWEEKSAAVKLTSKMKKSKRNKLWKKRKRQCVAEMRAKAPERFEQADREADEWREKEMAKDMANRKVEEMKAIEKVKAKRERRRLEPELELALIVEEMQELRSLRIEKLKKQGHFLPEEDDKFFESVRAAVEQEESQAQSLTNSETKENDIASKEGITSNKINKDTGRESNSIAASCEKTMEAPDNGCNNTLNLPAEFYHYYYGSNFDMGRLIEIRREWDAYLSPNGSRIPGRWVQPPPPASEIWASCLVTTPKRDTGKESNSVADSCENTMEAPDNGCLD